MKKQFLTLLIGLFLYTISYGSALAAPPPWEVEELMNKPAPDFSLNKLDGTTLNLSSLKGKVILVNFWATWCGPCLAEMPSLNALYAKFKRSDVEVIAISIDEKKDTITSFLKKFSFDFPIVHDPELNIANSYKVFAYPTTFLIDKNGILQKKYIGEQDWIKEEIILEIKTFLNN